MEKWNWVPATKVRLSNFLKIKTCLQVASKNFAKILIYLSTYISLNSGIVATKICDKSQRVN